MATDQTDTPFLTPRACSREFGGTPALWQKLAREKTLPAYRIGEVLIVFRREDVEQFIFSNPVTGPAACRDGRRRGKRPGRPRKYPARAPNPSSEESD